MSELRARFLAVAADPRIIPGVHRHCDEWCDYCHVSDRCLAFRCTHEYRKAHARKQGQETFATIDEAVTFTRDVSAAEGVSTAALDALLGNGSAPPEVTADPLAVSAWDYAVAVALAYGPQMFLAPDSPPRRGEPPSPEDILLWYHLRIYMRVFRAIAAVHRTELQSDTSDEALGSAKLALYSLKRSKQALTMLAETGRPNVGELAAKLDTLEYGIRERFPTADSYIRIGLDTPVA
jgi:hypothetical protein